MNISQKNILLVEDDENIRRDIALFLSYNDYSVIEASNGDEAYKLYQHYSIDLIITDVDMPYLDGLSLIERLRHIDTTIPIIIISGYGDQEKLLRAIKLNLVEYILKPIKRNALNQAIQRSFDSYNRPKSVELGQEYRFKMESKTLYKDQTQLPLTPSQSLTLELLILNKNTIVSPEDIFFHIHSDYTAEYSSASVRNIIKRLRKILSKEMIESFYGQGYSLKI